MLRIERTEPSDAGLYEVTLSNSYGLVREFIQLDVISKSDCDTVYQLEPEMYES